MWFLLFFGWTAAGAVSSFLVTQLGFPYTWVTPFTLVMLAAMFLLAYRGYQIRAWLLAGCVGFVLVSGMAIARALIVSEPDIPADYLAEFKTSHRQSLPGGLDEYLYTGYDADYVVEYDPERSGYLIPTGYGGSMPVTIDFEPMSTAGGQWAFESGRVRLRGGVSGTVRAEDMRDWEGTAAVAFEPGEAPRSAYPQMLAMLPLPMTPPREPIQVTASMDVSYPLPEGDVGQTTLTREFSLTVIGDEYYSYYQTYTEWDRMQSVLKTPIWMGLVLGSILAVAGGIYLIRDGALQPEPSSGLHMVVRRRSAFQQFGAEVLDLDKFAEAAPNVDQGVFVGRVVAQSPAGRGGLRTGDVLVELAGQQVTTTRAVNRLVKGRKKGERVSASVLRAGQRTELQIRF
ncbi:MAG TPA: PDZ domain-containing protein [Aggregatilinea sp.]|uniref:PDZ domain-containing protein n=1 Tax=Aggregatilinea sp. TaxID=2806333 RepID=UPI002CACE2D5|nr:PDZ domain-containing protein [Aggregatilinea sp.]HML24706.1 PDZ domain-containing protein [Aggregatilinea sp.]